MLVWSFRPRQICGDGKHCGSTFGYLHVMIKIRLPVLHTTDTAHWATSLVSWNITSVKYCLLFRLQTCFHWRIEGNLTIWIVKPNCNWKTNMGFPILSVQLPIITKKKIKWALWTLKKLSLQNISHWKQYLIVTDYLQRFFFPPNINCKY